MLGLNEAAGVVVWYCLVGVNWFQTQFVHPIAEWWLETVLGTWEESVKSVIRELFAQMIRIVNYILNAIFSWFPGYTSVKTSTQKPSAWKAWWEEGRQSTFNAIIERDRSVRGGTVGRSRQEEPPGKFATAACIAASLLLVSHTCIWALELGYSFTCALALGLTLDTGTRSGTHS